MRSDRDVPDRIHVRLMVLPTILVGLFLTLLVEVLWRALS